MLCCLFVQTVKLIVSNVHYSHFTTPTFWGVSCSPFTEVNGVETVRAFSNIFMQVLHGFSFP